LLGRRSTTRATKWISHTISNSAPMDIPKGMWVSLPQRHLHTHVIAALFTIANLWKQPRCSTIEEWIRKMWYLYTQPQRRVKFCHSQVNGWNWRKSS
jgi:hypothetical protein